MLQQVTVRTSDAQRLKPLLKTAIQNELKAIQYGIKRTKERLAAFEKQYAMSSDEFKHRFTADDLGESIDFIEWMGEIKTLELLEEKQDTLKQAKVS